MPNERPDATTKAEVADRSQAISSSNQELSSSIWEGMRTPANQLDAQPQRFSLSDTNNNNSASSADAPLSIRTGVNRGTESLPAVEFFDSAATGGGQGAKPSDSAVKPNEVAAQAQDSKPTGGPAEMKWETYSSSYVGGDEYNMRNFNAQAGTPIPGGAK